MTEKPEEEETEDVPIGQFVKDKKARTKHNDASKTASEPTKQAHVETQEQSKSGTIAKQGVTSSTIEKIVEKIEALKSQSKVILQGMSPLVISTVDRALVSKSFQREHIETPTPIITGIAAEFLSKGTVQEQAPSIEEVFKQGTLDQPIVQTKETIFENPQDIGTDNIAEVDLSVAISAEFSISKDGKSLFPEIVPSIATAKTIEQVETVTKQITLEQSQSTNTLEEQVPLEQTYLYEGTSILISAVVGGLSPLEQFKLKVSDFCQRITNPRAPTYLPESPIAQLKSRRSSHLPELDKPTFSQEEIQELKEILQQFSELNFEALTEGNLKVHLEICCQAAWVLKLAKAYQLCEVQERHLQRQSLKAALSSADDEAQSVISSYDQNAIRLHQLKKEEARLEEALFNVRGEIAQTTSNMQASMNRASSAVTNMRDLEDQLQRTTDQEEIYEFVCN